MKSTFEMKAPELVQAGLFWPECLSDAQLTADARYLETRSETMPHSLRMVVREMERRVIEAEEKD